MCTNFKYPTAKDGTACVGRTMEFPNEVPWQVAVAASGRDGKCTLVPNGKTWKSKYGIYADPQWFAIDLASTDFSTSRSVEFAHSGGPTTISV